jgi:hypothetical protein
MIGKGVGARQGTHTGAMGEAFGDFDALEYLVANHYAPVLNSSEWTEGAYVTGNQYNGIRDFLTSEPMGGDLPEPGKNPLTQPLNLSDYGFDIVGPEVHADGEIWVGVQYDIRELFLTRYPAQGVQLDIDCARGQVAVSQCPGNRRWIQDYYDSMVMMPRNATILQARDAMLAADQARFGGANLDLLWHAFAQRGFGQLASVVNNNDTDPVPDFSSPLANNATLTFAAVASDGNPLPVKANIYVGDYSARTTKIADTDPATTVGVNSDATAQFVPTDTGEKRLNTYNFVAVAPGYGHVRFMIDGIGRGDSRTITVRFTTNHAASAQGATATGDGTSQASLLDESEATVWNSTGAPVAGRQVVVDLAGTAPQTLRWANVSAMLTPANNRFTALRSFSLYACVAGKDPANPTCSGAIAAGWKTLVVSQNDAFPSVNPRPVTPDQTLRGWQLPSTQATHVKFVVNTNQCTGQTSYQGDQDNDPAVNADCRNGTGTSRATEVHAAELQLFTNPAVVRGPGVLNVDT